MLYLPSGKQVEQRLRVDGRPLGRLYIRIIYPHFP